jgi:phage terminase large subunit
MNPASAKVPQLIHLGPGTYTPLLDHIRHLKERFIVSYGGAGSGKSFSAAQNEIIKSFLYADMKTLVIRKVGKTLRDSVIPNFRSRISELQMDDCFRYHKTDGIIYGSNGSEIIFRGLDDPAKLKSFEGLQRIFIEEAAELEFDDLLELNRRARGRDNIQITLCFNPVHEQHWLKRHFFDNTPEDCATPIKTTYRDNDFLKEKDKEQIEWLRRYNNNQYRVYALGEWGVMENNNPWLFSFSREQHVKEDITFMPHYPVHLSFDFNRDPVTCLAVQMSPNRGQRDSFIHFIKEFSETEQLQQLCARIKTAFPSSFLYVTGDSTGSRGDIGFESRHASYYKMIQSYLRIPAKMMHLNTYNMEHHDSRNIINMMLAQYPNLYISQQGCPGLINECVIATVDESTHKPGILKKDRGVYKMDLFDCLRYFFQYYFKDFVSKVGLRTPGAGGNWY